MLGGGESSAYAQHMNAAEAPCQHLGSTVEATRCFSKAAGDADRDLNRAYGQIPKVLRPEDHGKLQAAERLWIGYRDAACAAERDLYGGGTGATPAHLVCLEAETRHHQTDLTERYGWQVEKFSR
jgi:uncharacterized protein YecT (DUF1311 family)